MVLLNKNKYELTTPFAENECLYIFISEGYLEEKYSEN